MKIDSVVGLITLWLLGVCMGIGLGAMLQYHHTPPCEPPAVVETIQPLSSDAQPKYFLRSDGTWAQPRLPVPIAPPR